MRRPTFLMVALVVALLWLMPMPAYGLDQSTFGGNTATDYQPSTGNPQSNIHGTLQPTNGTVQPVPTLDQQSLTQKGALSVLTAPDKGAPSTGADPTSHTKFNGTIITWLVGGLLTVVAVGFVLFQKDPQPKRVAAPVAADVPDQETTVLPTTPKKKAKKPRKKTSSKKKKSTRK